MLRAAPGDRIRLRVVNAASDTVFRLSLAGHRLTLTHSDGWPVEPVEGDSLLIAMGERYDLLVTLGDGAFPLTATPEGKDGQALALVRTASGSPLASAAATTAPAPSCRWRASVRWRAPPSRPERATARTTWFSPAR
ncbi:hypothetical protein [Phycicoccus sp. HDW14]|uniref:hypothetical protein n=1 Tax=Phycicoccus sp. HDW14 TaxID=2714941 RepID=UPI001F1068D7|nr:hypothetical protein [Phycicoccus sp. HDW14]